MTFSCNILVRIIDFPLTDSAFVCLQYIGELMKKDVKIIILTSFEKSARAVICEAFQNVKYHFMDKIILKKVFECNHINFAFKFCDSV